MNLDLLVAAGVAFLIAIVVIRYAVTIAVMAFLGAIVLVYFGLIDNPIDGITLKLKAAEKADAIRFESDRLFSEDVGASPFRDFKAQFPSTYHHI